MAASAAGVTADVHVFFATVGPTARSPLIFCAAATVEEPDAARQRLEALRAELVGDRFRARLPAVRALRRRRFGYAADHESVRRAVLATLAALPGSIDLAFATREDLERTGQPPSLLYHHLMAPLRVGGRRLGRSVGRRLAGERRRDGVAHVYLPRGEIPAEKPESDEAVQFHAVDDDDAGFVLPDYAIGVVRDAMACGTGALDESAVALARGRFELLATRLRRVQDCGKGVVYMHGAFAEEIARLCLRN